MAAKKSVLVGIAAIVVIGVVAVVYFSQWPPSSEDATGAIGAAERYRAEQITDEDVILDLPGQEQLAGLSRAVPRFPARHFPLVHPLPLPAGRRW